MSVETKQIVFLKAETMLASLSARPSWGNASNRIQDVFVQEDDGVKYFPYTHSAEISANASDEDAVRAALGESTKYWGGNQLKILRVSADDIVSETHVDLSNYVPCPKNQKYYNYVEANMLHLDEAEENLNWSHEPEPQTRDHSDLKLTA